VSPGIINQDEKWDRDRILGREKTSIMHLDSGIRMAQVMLVMSLLSYVNKCSYMKTSK
jgi:hypothetical protein